MPVPVTNTVSSCKSDTFDKITYELRSPILLWEVVVFKVLFTE